MKTESRKCNDNVLGDRGNKMNWKSIKKKYPKAFKLLDKTVDIFWDCRFLYDFFDEQGITVEVVFAYTRSSYNRGENLEWFEYSVYSDFIPNCCSRNEPDYCEPYKTKHRTEAEEQAFLKAFEILEEKIK
jgi:hypothetical protein